MLDIEFDRTIDTGLPAAELWTLIKQAFENPAESVIWPVELEEVNPVELRCGAIVEATYKIGPLRARPSYRITEFERGHSFSYESTADHPLQGGATVEVEPMEPRGSTLRWHGSYRPRLHPLAPGAVAFVRLYFLRTFFAHLASRLRTYEKTFYSTGGTGEERL